MQTFRDAIRRASPSWLTGYWGYRLLYAMAIQLDALGDAVTFGVKLRFPGVYSGESLPLIGRERGIVRGFDETDAAYTARLLRWLDALRRKGSPYELLRQLRGYLTGHDVRIRVVNNGGAWYTQNVDGSTEYVLAANWNWDGSTAAWSRFWVILYPPAELWTRDGTWGDGSVWGDDGTTWGCTAPIEQAETIRGIVAEWSGAHSRCVNIIVSFDPAAFNPTDTTPPLPDGTWGHWGKLVGGVMVPARDARALYMDGVS